MDISTTAAQGFGKGEQPGMAEIPVDQEDLDLFQLWAEFFPDAEPGLDELAGSSMLDALLTGRSEQTAAAENSAAPDLSDLSSSQGRSGARPASAKTGPSVTYQRRFTDEDIRRRRAARQAQYRERKLLEEVAAKKRFADTAASVEAASLERGSPRPRRWW